MQRGATMSKSGLCWLCKANSTAGGRQNVQGLSNLPAKLTHLEIGATGFI